MSNVNLKEINACAKLLIEKELSIAFAESATCGRIASEFSLTQDAGKFLKGGISCYDACIKENLLNVDHELIEKYTPESAEVTKAITQGIGELLDSDILIGCTGLPCPGGSETLEKPVGTMFIHGIHHHKTIFADRPVFSGDPLEIIESTVNRTAKLLKAYLNTLS